MQTTPNFKNQTVTVIDGYDMMQMHLTDQGVTIKGRVALYGIPVWTTLTADLDGDIQTNVCTAQGPIADAARYKTSRLVVKAFQEHPQIEHALRYMRLVEQTAAIEAELKDARKKAREARLRLNQHHALLAQTYQMAS